MVNRRNNNMSRYASPEHELVTAGRVTISASPLGQSMDLAPILGDERTPLIDPSAGFKGLQTIRVIEGGQQFTNIPDRYPDLVFTSVAMVKLGLDDKGRASDTMVQDCIVVPYINHPSNPRRRQGEKEWEYLKKVEEQTEAARSRSQARQKALAEGDLLSSLETIQSYRVIPVNHTFEDGTFKKVFYVDAKWDVDMEGAASEETENYEGAAPSNFEDEVLG